ncbi:sigma factor [Cyclobacterium marinum]|uniref:sigma factor n=1 Tax=Cyclobacterium marinum TaxID=104 RepID=UPI0002D359AA|nr:sigma factor [Cyclobacterium marinum]
MNKELETLFLEGLEINQQRLFRICRVYSTNSEDAKDLFQEILIHVWGGYGCF